MIGSPCYERYIFSYFLIFLCTYDQKLKLERPLCFQFFFLWQYKEFTYVQLSLSACCNYYTNTLVSILVSFLFHSNFTCDLGASRKKSLIFLHVRFKNSYVGKNKVERIEGQIIHLFTLSAARSMIPNWLHKMNTNWSHKMNTIQFSKKHSCFLINVMLLSGCVIIILLTLTDIKLFEEKISR